MNGSFVFYESFWRAIENLPAEKYKECMQALLAYAIDGYEVDTDDLMVNMYVSMAKPLIDANTTRRENGGKGGRPRKVVSESKTIGSESKTIGSEQKTIGFETENHRFQGAKPNVNVNVNENVNGNVNVNGDGDVNVNDHGEVPPIVPHDNINAVPEVSEDELEQLGVPSVLTEPVSEWIANRDAKNQTLTQGELKSLVSTVKANAAKHGAQAVSDLIRESMANGYKGISWDRLGRNRGKPGSTYTDRIDHRMDVVDEWARAVGAYEGGTG